MTRKKRRNSLAQALEVEPQDMTSSAQNLRLAVATPTGSNVHLPSPYSVHQYQPPPRQMFNSITATDALYNTKISSAWTAFPQIASSTSSIQTYCWKLIISLMLFVFIWEVYAICGTYHKYGATATMNEKHFSDYNPIPFPAVTFCNMGKFFWPKGKPHVVDIFRTWGIDPMHVKYMKKYKTNISEAWATDSLTPDTTGKRAHLLSDYNNTFSGFFDKWGFQANKDTIIQMKYQNQAIKHQDYDKYLKKTYTNIGTCYTFGAENGSQIKETQEKQISYNNGENTEPILEGFLGKIPFWMQVIIAKITGLDYKKLREEKLRHQGLENTTDKGTHMGFSIVINVNQDKYFFDPSGANLDAGIKFRVHAAYEPPEIENYGDFVGTGQRCYTTVQLKDETFYETPWGRCQRKMEIDIMKGTKNEDGTTDDNVKGFDGMKFYSRYTRNGCIKECLRSEMIRDCSCVPYNHILDKARENVTECTGKKAMECSAKYHEQLSFLVNNCMDKTSSVTNKSRNRRSVSSSISFGTKSQMKVRDGAMSSKSEGAQVAIAGKKGQDRKVGNSQGGFTILKPAGSRKAGARRKPNQSSVTKSLEKTFSKKPKSKNQDSSEGEDHNKDSSKESSGLDSDKCKEDYLVARVKDCMYKCPFSCHYDKYDTEISYATFPSKSAALMWSKYLHNSDSEEVKGYTPEFLERNLEVRSDRFSKP